MTASLQFVGVIAIGAAKEEERKERMCIVIKEQNAFPRSSMFFTHIRVSKLSDSRHDKVQQNTEKLGNAGS